MRFLLILILALAGTGFLPAYAAQVQTNAAINECKSPTLRANGLTEESARHILPGTMIEVLCPDGESQMFPILSGGTVWGLIDLMLSSPEPVAKATPLDAPKPALMAPAPATPVAVTETKPVASPAADTNAVPIATVTPDAVTASESTSAWWLAAAIALIILFAAMILVLAGWVSNRRREVERLTNLNATLEAELAHSRESYANHLAETGRARAERDAALVAEQAAKRAASISEGIAEFRRHQLEALEARLASSATAAAVEPQVSPAPTPDKKYIVIAKMDTGILVEIPFTLTGEKSKPNDGRIIEFAQGPWEQEANHPFFITRLRKRRSFANEKLRAALNRMPDYVRDWFYANARVQGPLDILELTLKEPETNVTPLPVRLPKVANG